MNPGWVWRRQTCPAPSRQGPQRPQAHTKVTVTRKRTWTDGRTKSEDYYATYAMSRINVLDFMIIGGARLDKPRFMWWNFVSTRMDRIEQAKIDWAEHVAAFHAARLHCHVFILPAPPVTACAGLKPSSPPVGSKRASARR